jgi:hypothetical protein
MAARHDRAPIERAPVERPAASAPTTTPADLAGGLVWETPAASAPERPAAGMRYGRQPALKTGRAAGYVPPATDPNRRPTSSEAPASAPRAPEASPPPSSPRREIPRVEAEVREVKGPLPGVDASRYRAAEAPASRFASETPTAWDEDPKEHE